MELAAYATKTNRRKLVGAYSDKSPLVAVYSIPEDTEFMLTSTSGRMLLVHTGAISAKSTRSTIGVQVITLKGKHTLAKAVPFTEDMAVEPLPHKDLAGCRGAAGRRGSRGTVNIVKLIPFSL